LANSRAAFAELSLALDATEADAKAALAEAIEEARQTLDRRVFIESRATDGSLIATAYSRQWAAVRNKAGLPNDRIYLQFNELLGLGDSLRQGIKTEVGSNFALLYIEGPQVQKSFGLEANYRKEIFSLSTEEVNR
jgi:hypothetical protein